MANTPNDFVQQEINASVNEDPSNEDLARAMASRFGSLDETTDGAAVEGETAPETTPGSESAPSSTQPVVADASTTSTSETSTSETLSEWEFSEGKKIDKDTAEAYFTFRQFLTDNPDFAEAMRGLAQGKLRAVPVEEPEATSDQGKLELPPEVDPDDPAVKYILAQQQALENRINEFNSQLENQGAIITQQTQATTESLVNRAVKSFQKDKGLSEDEINEIRDLASSMQVLPALMQAVDPLTGVPRKVDPLGAIERALEIAYWTKPEYREKEILRQMQEQREDTKRKGKLTALGGSSGSVPRTPKEPTTPEEKRNAMINEVAQMMQSGHSTQE